MFSFTLFALFPCLLLTNPFSPSYLFKLWHKQLQEEILSVHSRETFPKDSITWHFPALFISVYPWFKCADLPVSLLQVSRREGSEPQPFPFSIPADANWLSFCPGTFICRLLQTSRDLERGCFQNAVSDTEGLLLTECWSSCLRGWVLTRTLRNQCIQDLVSTWLLCCLNCPDWGS